MTTAGVKVLTIGKAFQLPKDYEARHLDKTSSIFSTIATFQPDVLVTSTFTPGVLMGCAFDIRKKWIHVDPNAKVDAVIQAIESCYSSNLWGEHQFQKQNPLISVYTGTYNTGDYLREAYQSLIEQTYKNWEWVCVDDHSTDGTWERLEAFAKEDIRVRPFRSGKSIGKIGGVKDLATRLSKGAYLVELDHDDFLTDFALEEIRKAFDSDPEIGMVYSNCANFFEDGSAHRFPFEHFQDKYREIEYRGKRWLECINHDIYGSWGQNWNEQNAFTLTVGPNHVRAYRAKTLFELGGYNPSLPVADDWDVYSRFYLYSKCHHIDKFLYAYRFRDGYQNTTFTRNKSIQDHLALGQNYRAAEFKKHHDKRIGTQGQVPVAEATSDKPCFVIASRSEKDAERIKGRLPNQDVFVKVGAKGILEAYEEGRLFWKDRRRIVYVHDDVLFNDFPAFVSVVAKLQPGLHGPCGSAAPDALDNGPWWESKPHAGRYIQSFKDGTASKTVELSKEAKEVSWLDGFCLVAVDQAWSWDVPGKPFVWHGYDWLACKKTKASGGKCFTLPQDAPLLAHEGFGRMDGLLDTMRLLRTLTRTGPERRDYPNIHEHLPEIEASAKGIVLELGSREGSSTEALLKGVERRGGKVWSVDVDPSYADAWRGHPLWQFVACDSADVDSLQKAGLPEQLDVLFIDSEHTYARVKKELATWAPRVRPGGLILMHDTESFPDVKKAAIEFTSARGLQIELRKNCNGLGVIRIPEDTAQISYVVPTAVPSELAIRCLKSIREFSPRSEIILVANGCEPLPEAMKLADKVVRLEMNLRFAAGCNRGAMEATRKVICIMNDDSCFVDDTPKKLFAAISEKYPLVAPYCNRAKPPQGDRERSQVPNESLHPEMVVGVCVMLPTDLYRTLRGFDPRLDTYEDDDICARASSLGYGCTVVGGTYVEHERHATFKALREDVQTVMSRNGEIFRQKHPKIRVIAISKNEEAGIRGYFEQFSTVTRDWCLFDTGSKDRTVEIATSIGVRVERGAFANFAQARNLAITQFGQGADWIIMLDPDERLDSNTVQHMKEMVFRTEKDIFLAPLQATYGDGSVRDFVPKPFLWRNRAQIQWIFKVHEKLVGSQEQAIIVNAKINHILALHEDGRRQGASTLYDTLAVEEPYFTDAQYRKEISKEWPILDYDRMDDPRIEKLTLGPLVSVVIPTYKRPELLKRAVSSALAQDYANLEIVVVGDRDPTLDSPESPRVRALNLPKNHGAGGAVPRNFGIMMAAGEFIAYCDDDNAITPDHISSIYDAMRRNGATFGFSSMLVGEVDMKFTEPKHQGIDTSCILHQKDLILKYGWWKDRQEAGYSHDWEFFNRWVKGGERWVCTRKPTLQYNAETSGQREFLATTAKA